MKRWDNYAIQAQQAKDLFLTYDQEKLIAKFGLEADETFLYTKLLGRPYRIARRTGDLEKLADGIWISGNSHGEVLTLMDLLCDSRDDRCLTGRWKAMQNFGLMFHQSLLEDRRDANAEMFDQEPERLRRGCEALDGRAMPGADISYAVELFDGLAILIRFWHGDEEFAPRIRYFWDENALRYIRYETMWYAIGLLMDRLTEA